MIRILKHMKRPLPAKIVLRPLWICLTGTLINCSGLKPFPTKKIIEYDAKNKVCGEYKITDPENLKVEYVGDIPCPDTFGFTAQDIPKVLDWAKDAQEYVRTHCNK